jgi:hypothetical protein
MTTPELDAIRGHSSAASFATGPVMAEPFISPLGLTICVCQQFVPPAIGVRIPLTTPALSSKYRHDLLPQLRLSLLDSRHDHVSRTTGRQTVKTRTNALDGDDVQVAGTGVVAAVHDGAAVLPLAKLP